MVGLALAVGVWWGLVTGGGLVGGDTYPYFMPQKQLMAEEFARGNLPLWHDRTGLGYPLLAESQAGVLYPSNQLLYRVLSVNTAYSASLVLHYWLAFVFAWRFARSQTLSMWPAMLASLVYVYGWFPARVSLEWSIIGGVWLPLTLWLTDSLLKKPSRRMFVTLTVCLAVHLLAGHFTLAFINQMTLMLYAGLQWWLGRTRSGVLSPRELEPLETSAPGTRQAMKSSLSEKNSQPPDATILLVPAAIAVSLLLAAAQLLPTLELKQVSQREGVHQAFDPAYGHLPPLYVTQLVASWTFWHTPEVLAARVMLDDPLAIDADTNAVEAHLYWGLIPLVLIGCTAPAGIRGRLPARVYRTWITLSLLGLIYATGWLLPVTRHLPGFAFFMGPARYTIVAALGGGILGGLVLEHLLRHRGAQVKFAVTAVVMAVTLPDLLASSRYVADAIIVDSPPIEHLEESWLREHFTSQDSESPEALSEQRLAANSWEPRPRVPERVYRDHNVEPSVLRLLAPGPNVGNLYGVSCVPTYLGLGPSFYFSDSFDLQATPESPDDEFPSAAQADRLRGLAVTHVITESAVENPSDDLELVNGSADALLNRLWGRGMKPVWLYRFRDRPPRVTAAPVSALNAAKLVSSLPKRVEFELTLNSEANVELRDLMYPGWQVTVDGERRTPNDSVFRTVKLPTGQHHVVWEYGPQVFRIGLWVSLLTATGLAATFVLRKRA